MKRVAITGSNGYVGSAIARCFTAQGWEVLHLTRRSEAGQPHAAYDLRSDPKTIPWNGVNALVHCAYDFRPTKWKEIEEVNVQGTIRLLDAARAAGVNRGVFISSLSAFDGCRSLYGKAKLLLEAEAIRRGYAAVRPGLVHGDTPGGMMGSLEKTASKGKFVPLIGDGSYPQYLAHEEDLAGLVFELCHENGPAPQRAISAANPQPIPFKELLQRIASRNGRQLSFIPIPWPLLYSVLKTAELLHLPAPFRSDSLIGFVFQNRNPDFSLPEGIMAKFRPFA